MPFNDPIRTLSPGIASRTQRNASPSSREMAMSPLERILAKADNKVRLTKPPLVSITNWRSSPKLSTASKEVIASSRGIGSSCTTGVPLAVRLQTGTR